MSCLTIRGTTNNAKAIIKDENEVFVIADNIAVSDAIKILASQTIKSANRISCKLLNGISTDKRESPKLVCISASQPVKPYCATNPITKIKNTPKTINVAKRKAVNNFAIICRFFPYFVVRIKASVFKLYSLEKIIETAIIITINVGIAIASVGPQNPIKKYAQLSLYPYCKGLSIKAAL